MAIQEKLDKALTDAGRNMPRVVVNNESGDANVPANMSVDFRNCSISSLTTAGNNRINIEGGSVSGDMNLTGTALIARNCTLSGTVNASSSSKIEFDNVTANGQVNVTSTSQMVGKHCTYTQQVSLSSKSVLRSVLDTFSGTQMLTLADAGTSAVVLQCTASVTTLVSMTGGAKLEIDGGTVQCTDMGTVDGSVVEVRNCTSVTATTGMTLSNASRAVFRKMPSVQVTSGFTLTGKSYMEVVDVQTFSSTATTFSLDNSRIEVTRFVTLATNDAYVTASNGSFARIASGTTMRPQKSFGTFTDSSLVVDKITTLISAKALCTATRSSLSFTDITSLVASGGVGFDLTTSSLLLTGCHVAGASSDKFVTMTDISSFSAKNCPNLQANSSTLVTGTNQGEVHISGSSFVFGQTGVIDTTGVFTVTITGCTTVTSAQDTIKMSSNGGSTLNLSSCDNITTSSDSAIRVTGVDTFLTALPNIANNGTRYTIRGDDGGSQRQQMICSKIVVVGGFDLEWYTVKMFATTFDRFNMRNTEAEFSRVINTDSYDQDNSSFSFCVIRDCFGDWHSTIHGDQSVLQFQRSNVRNHFATTDSVLRCDVLNGSDGGFQSPGGGSRGNTMFAAGYDVGTVQTNSNNKDTFIFTNVGNPSYSGRGSLIVMESGEPDEGNLEYLLIKDNNLRLFDYRGTYEDFTNKINRNSVDNIQDDADMNIYVTAQQLLEMTGTTEAELISDSVIILEAPSILEQS